MSPRVNDLSSNPEKSRSEATSDLGSQTDRAPFDNSDLQDIPQPLSDDPPYQHWWVVDGPDREAGHE